MSVIYVSNECGEVVRPKFLMLKNAEHLCSLENTTSINYNFDEMTSYILQLEEAIKCQNTKDTKTKD